MTPSALGTTVVADALDSAIGALTASGCDTPRLDAELLLAEALDTDRACLLREPDRPVIGAAVRAFQDAVRRRALAREPVAYILGRRAFRHLELKVDPRVLIPRRETELLVEVAVEELPPDSRVLDVGTGSGAVALALRHERSDLIVAGSDVSAGALALARDNASRLGLEAQWIEADLLGDRAAWARRFDAIVSNPPYVAQCEYELLAPEIVRHEPADALLGGPDGLAVTRRLIHQAGRTGTRLLALEIGYGQADAVSALMVGAGFADVSRRRDLAGIERVLLGRR